MNKSSTLENASNMFFNRLLMVKFLSLKLVQAEKQFRLREDMR